MGALCPSQLEVITNAARPSQLVPASLITGSGYRAHPHSSLFLFYFLTWREFVQTICVTPECSLVLMGLKSSCFHCAGVNWMPTLMLFQRQKHPSPKSVGNFQSAVSPQCPPPSPLLPVHRPMGTLADMPHSDQP